MFSNRQSVQRRRARALSEVLEQRWFLSAVTWDGGGDGTNWNNALNWSNDAVPTGADDVTIGAASVSIAGAAANASSVNSQGLLTVNTSSLTVTHASSASAITVLGNAGTVSGGTWNVTNVSLKGGTLENGAYNVSGSLTADISSTNTLSNTSVSGSIVLSDMWAKLKVTNGSTFTLATLTGFWAALGFSPGSVVTGEIRIGGDTGNPSIDMISDGTLTFASSAKVWSNSIFGTVSQIRIGGKTTFTGKMTLLQNAGQIIAGGAQTTYLLAQSVANTGLLRADVNATLYLSATSWTNQGGTIDVISSGKVVLLGSTTTAGIGTIPSGNKVTIGGTIDNTNSVLWIYGNTITGLTIIGGSAYYSGATPFTVPVGGFLKLYDVTIGGMLSVGGKVDAYGNTHFGSLRLNHADAVVNLPAGYIVDFPVEMSSGRIVFDTAIGGSGDAQIASGTTVFIYGSGGGLYGSTGVSLQNYGTITVDNSPGSYAGIGMPLVNRGTIDVKGGIFAPSVFEQRGTFTVRATNAGTFLLGASFTMFPGSTTSIAGTLLYTNGLEATVPGNIFTSTGGVDVQSGTLIFADAFPGANVAVSGPESMLRLDSSTPSQFKLTLNGGEIRAAADVTLVGASTWAKGTLAGPAKYIVASGATFSLLDYSSTNELQTRLENGGTMSLGNNKLYMSGAGSLVNKLGGAMTSVIAEIRDRGTAGTFTNQGTFTHSGSTSTNTSLVFVPLTNSGTMRSTKGVLHCLTGTNSGSFVADASAFVRLEGSFTHTGSAPFSGAGLFTLANGTHDVTGGLYNLAGFMTIAVPAKLIVANAISGGTLTVNGTLVTNVDQSFGANLVLQTGTIDGPGNITITGPTAVTDGTFQGAGTLTINSGVTMNFASLLTLARATTNFGSIASSAANAAIRLDALSLSDGVVLRNAVGGKLTLQNGCTVLNNSTGSPVLDNRGRIDIFGNATFTGVRLVNGGIVNASSGFTRLRGGGTNEAGSSLLIPGTGTMEFAGTWTHANGATFTAGANGTLLFSGGVQQFDAALAVAASVKADTTLGALDLRFAKSPQMGGLQITGGTARVSIAPGNAQPIRTGTFILINAPTLDLADNDLIITAAAKSIVEGHVRAGYNFGDWQGARIVSTTARDNPLGNTTLGVMSGDEFNNNNGGTFDGVVVNNTDVLVKYTYFGDVDFNGSVDASDYNLIDFGYSNHLTGWANGDADYSGGATDVSDYNLIDFAFTTQSGVL